MKATKESKPILLLIGTIMILILTTILSAGCFEDDYEERDVTGDDLDSDSEVKIKPRSTTKGDLGWMITIESVSGKLDLEGVKFRLLDQSNIEKSDRFIRCGARAR